MARVLVVDDEADIRFLIRAWLEKQGHSVNLASNGREALIAARLKRPDVILLDLNMPEMNGLHTLVSLKQQPEFQQVPVIVVTANDGIPERVYSVIQGAADFLSKPLDWGKLERTIHRVLAS